MSIELRRVKAPGLTGFDLTVEQGITVVLGARGPALATLVDLVAGAATPRRGSVTVEGRRPFRDPELRRRIGAALHAEELLGARAVADSVTIALDARNAKSSARATLDRFGMASLADRAPGDLSPEESRAVATCIALSTPAPVALALYEPLRTPARADAILDAMARAAEEGVPILCATSSARDASRLEGPVHVLHGGRITRQAGVFLARDLTLAQHTDLLVRSNDARSLLEHLASAPGVEGVEWEGSPRRDDGVVRVRCADLDVAALGIARAARAAGVRIESMHGALPSIEAVAAANVRLARYAGREVRR